MWLNRTAVETIISSIENIISFLLLIFFFFVGHQVPSVPSRSVVEYVIQYESESNQRLFYESEIDFLFGN